jgi:signal transduction histidine kinase/HPt (histidine-containing phosphotransfer) domain-containing protein/BarA-like signal transduction histidine kinase
MLINDDDELIFAEETPSSFPEKIYPTWKVMIIDDDPEIHNAIQFGLSDFFFEEKGLTLISGYSSEQAKSLLNAHPDTALIFLDVVMEENDSGLTLVHYIRETLKNQLVRIILHTGQPGAAPEESVIVDYDINDYRFKAEMTQRKLFVTMTAGLRAYRDFAERQQAEKELQKHRDHLEKLVAERTKSAEEAKLEAQNANQAKSIFLANMSHEIRTPINAIKGLTKLALKTNLTAQQKDYLIKIESSSQALLEVINDILDFSKIEAGQLKMESINFYLDEELEQLFNILGMRIEEKGLKLLLNIDETVPRSLLGDPLRLKQILINLTTNAIKFTTNGSIHIKIELVERKAEQVKLRFSITDTGIGISAEVIPYLFDTFTQADASTTREFGGTGLGLAICKRLTNMMGGDISVESQLEQGSTFIFTAEFGVGQTEKNVLSAKKPLQIKHLQGARILLVEDNSINQQVAQEIIESVGLVVDIANNGEEAVAAVNNVQFDAVLMDIQMPKMDGYEATRLIRKKRGELPIIAMTAHAMSGDKEKCLAAGMNDYISKPIDETQLWSTLGKWIATKVRDVMPVKSEPVDELLLDELPDINIAAGLKRMLGNRQLYHKLLRHFHRDYQDVSQKINEALQNGDFKTAQYLVHTIKGTAGNLSIDILYEASRTLEIAIKAEDEIIPALFKQFEEVLTTVMKTLATLNDVSADEFSCEKTDPAVLMPLLQKLEIFLNDYDYRALDMLPEIKRHLSKDLQSFYQELEKNVEDFEFDEALKTLVELIKTFQNP